MRKFLNLGVALLLFMLVAISCAPVHASGSAPPANYAVSITDVASPVYTLTVVQEVALTDRTCTSVSASSFTYMAANSFDVSAQDPIPDVSYIFIKIPQTGMIFCYNYCGFADIYRPPPDFIYISGYRWQSRCSFVVDIGCQRPVEINLKTCRC